MKKKLHFSFKNIRKDKALTIIGIVAGVALPIITQKVDPESIGGSLIIMLVGALAGTKKHPVIENVEEVKEIVPDAKAYVDEMVKQTKKDLPKFKK